MVYLLLFGELPTENQQEDLKDILAEYRKSLPSSFVRDIIMKAPSSDLMNTLGRSVLTLYSYDTKADDTTTENVLRQCLELVALLPMFAVYGYQAANYFHEGSSFFLHPPKEEYSTAENILHMLRPDSKFTPLEAKILDIALVLHAEHGGGNNSTFTDHVVTSSGTDTYAAISAALGSLKGPRHGGANKKVSLMFEDMKKNVHDWEDDEEIKTYLTALLNKQAFDRSGLIYGMGHAVYSISDPRAKTFRKFVKKLSEEKNMLKEYALYEKGRKTCTGSNRGRTPYLQRCQCQYRFLQRTCVQYAGTSDRVVYPDFCHWKNRRLECTSTGRTCKCRKDYPSGLQSGLSA